LIRGLPAPDGVDSFAGYLVKPGGLLQPGLLRKKSRLAAEGGGRARTSCWGKINCTSSRIIRKTVRGPQSSGATHHPLKPCRRKTIGYEPPRTKLTLGRVSGLHPDKAQLSSPGLRHWASVGAELLGGDSVDQFSKLLKNLSICFKSSHWENKNRRHNRQVHLTQSSSPHRGDNI
jgi:hypothetical protein